MMFIMSEPVRQGEQEPNYYLDLYKVSREQVARQDLLRDNNGAPLEREGGVFSDGTEEVYKTDTGFVKFVPDTDNGVKYKGTGEPLKDPHDYQKRIGAEGIGLVNEVVNVSFVFGVQNQDGNRFVAKALPWSPATLKEAGLMMKINHPNVLSVEDLAISNPDRPELRQIFIITKDIEGQSFSWWLKQQHTLDEVGDIFSQVASGLDYIHKSGLIHGDINDENILFDDLKPVITDMGLAKETEGKEIVTGQPLGVVPYTPIEQSEGKFSQKGDIYALGVLLFNTISDDINPNNMLLKLFNFQTSGTLTLKDEYKHQLQGKEDKMREVLLGALEQKLENRKYTSASEFVGDFINTING